MRKICVVTGSRADWGLLSRLTRMIADDPELELQIIATNMHLSPEYGLTYEEILKDGFAIDKKIEMLVASDTATGTVKSMGLEMIGLADAYAELQPDLLVLLGDRYEMLVAASAALPYRIPVAHLYGGEVTEGAYDDAIRHAITKMSHLHFTSTETYRRRIIQMGEAPERVFYVGAMGVENGKRLSLLTKEELQEQLDFDLGDKSFLITFHPVTLENNSAREEIENLLKALEKFPDYKLLFTYPNSDTNGKVIIRAITAFIERHRDRSKAFVSLGKIRYLSALQYVSAVVGNSSSGIIEVPSFRIPTLDIGDRQKGRIAAESILHCGSGEKDIEAGLKKITGPEFQEKAGQVRNPYEKPETTESIFEILKDYPLQQLVKKTFYDL